MECMLKTITESLKDADLEKVSKADLRKQYLEKVGLTELSKEDKKLFSSAVNTAYLGFISSANKIDDSSKNIKPEKALKNGSIHDCISEKKEDLANRVVDSPSAEEEITPSNITEKILSENMEIDSDDEPFKSFKDGNAKKLSNDSKKLSNKRPLISSSDDDFTEKMKNKKIIHNKIQKKKRARFSFNKDNECFSKNISSDSEDEPVISLTGRRSNSLKNSKDDSSLSEDEPLTNYSKKKSNSFKKSTKNNSSESENEPITKYSKKSTNSFKKSTSNNASESEDEPIVTSSKKRSNTSNELLKNNSNESGIKFSKTKIKNSSNIDDISLFQESNDSSFSKVKPVKKFVSSSDSEDEQAITINKKKTNSENQSTEKNLSVSENVPVKKFVKKKAHNSKNLNDSKVVSMLSMDSSSDSDEEEISKSYKNSDSEDEPLTKYSKKKLNTFDESLKNNSSESENESIIKFSKNRNSTNIDDISLYQGSNDSSFFKVEPVKNFVSSSDSEDEQVVIVSEKKMNSENQSTERNVSDSENVSDLNLKNSNDSNKKDQIIKCNITSDSEDEPLTKYSKKKSSNSIDSEDEPLTSITKKKSDSSNESTKVNLNKSVKILSKRSNSSKVFTKSSSNESEDEPLATFVKKKSSNTTDSDDDFVISKSKKKFKSLNRSSRMTINSSDSEDEPLTKFMDRKPYNSKNSKKKSEERMIKKKQHSYKIDGISTLNVNSSDESEEKPLIKFGKKKNNSNSDDDMKIKNQQVKKLNNSNEKLSSVITDSSEDEPLSKFAEKKSEDTSDSEHELLMTSTSKESKKSNGLERSSSLSADENDLVEVNSKNKLSNKKQDKDFGKKKEQKHSSASENKIEHLKKYVRAAGLRVQCYTKLFENCKSVKAKCEKLLHLLEKEGLKGRPTLEKCKKLKKKIETKKEIAELDVSNILVTKGRSKRTVCSDATNFEPKSANSSPIKSFSRLKGIVESEESD
ncbi:uncharacterized protein NPIL_80231 [Nephila pilipes]|uniref:Histone chaperone domain-containing protein n=1 Tax=Nephila pilipes TaxID=299642 RepID=A0A8X6Q4H2_NEPPI|nr:uncharacterized protein NPIL_80231 [Nephila pilipes]